MKNVQIPQELFMKLLRYHLLDDGSCADDVKKGLEVCKLSVHKVLLFQKKYWYKMYSKMSVEGFEKLIEEFRNECNNER